MKAFYSLSVLLLAYTVSTAAARGDELQNWHHWRGPLANGVAPTANPPLNWDEKTNLQWKVEVPGRGTSTPIIWENRVFLTTAIDTGKPGESSVPGVETPNNPFNIKKPGTFVRFVVLCLDRSTGRVLWEKTAIETVPHEGHHHDNSFASASPTTDGRQLYVSFGSRGVYCYTLDGEPRWTTPLEPVVTRLNFGEACSPVVHGDSVVLNRDNEGKSQIVVLDAQTGKQRWKSDREEVSAWATPLVVDFQGRTQVITNASHRVRSYDLKTGEVIWQCGGQVGNVIPSPVRYGDTVLCLSGYRGSAAFAIPLDSQGDITGTDKIVWHYDRDTPYVPSPLLYGDLLYFNKSNNGILTCLDARTGKPVWDAKRVQNLSNVYASPVGAADRVYFVARDGTTVVLQHGRELAVLATNRLEDPIDASPAVAGNQIFLRGRKYLYCCSEQ